jgi:hypothetical protein
MLCFCVDCYAALLDGIIEYIDANLPVAGSFEETDSPAARARARALLLARLVCPGRSALRSEGC